MPIRCCAARLFGLLSDDVHLQRMASKVDNISVFVREAHQPGSRREVNKVFFLFLTPLLRCFASILHRLCMMRQNNRFPPASGSRARAWDVLAVSEV